MNDRLEELAGSVQRIYSGPVAKVGERFAWERRPSEGEVAGTPLVLVLGNHSSGKSTFINHLLGMDVQKTGLAPTDDGFTVLAHGLTEEDRDGQAMVSNPDLPWAGLRHFGPQLLNHLRLKLQPVELLERVTLIDSPGMIDTPGEGQGRGYDFGGVVRWLAERADLVLVFFDPDKPGTTGETLEVFTQSLQGIDHKLRIVMNKVDLFRGMQDFARAYGALCWNLGKVIPSKDLPLIFNSFVPVKGAPEPALPVGDFDCARAELEAEVERAPAKRVDNLLTQLHDFTQRLRLHARVIHAAASDLRALRLRLWGPLILIALLGILASAASISSQADWWLSFTLVASTVLVAVGGRMVMRWLLSREEERTLASLDAVFERVHARDLLVLERAEDLRALWGSVASRTRETAEKIGLFNFPRLRSGELTALNTVLEEELPSLRARLHREDRAPSPPPVPAGV